MNAIVLMNQILGSFAMKVEKNPLYDDPAGDCILVLIEYLYTSLQSFCAILVSTTLRIAPNPHNLIWAGILSTGFEYSQPFNTIPLSSRLRRITNRLRRLARKIHWRRFRVRLRQR